MSSTARAPTAAGAGADGVSRVDGPASADGPPRALMRLGTRGSALALAQARWVAGLLGEEGVEVVVIASGGDRDATGAAAEGSATADAPGGDKSRWVGALERALLDGEIDLAVHSAKDVPGELAAGLALFGAPARGAVEDVLCIARGARGDRSPRAGEAASGATAGGGLESLAPGARIGTSSLRRGAQLRAAREDLDVVELRGNVDTRLRRLADGELDAIVLARAGLQRLAREGEVGAVLDPTRFVPAPGQGTLALEGRAGDERARAVVEAITDATAFAALRAERALAQGLDASCATPLGAYAADAGCGCLYLRAWVGLPDGSRWIADELLGGFYDPEQLGRRVAERMLAVGAGELLGAVGEVY
jgi:hydroxymethylbilane synthase